MAVSPASEAARDDRTPPQTERRVSSYFTPSGPIGKGKEASINGAPGEAQLKRVIRLEEPEDDHAGTNGQKHVSRPPGHEYRDETGQ